MIFSRFFDWGGDEIEKSAMKKKLLNKAKSLGFEVYQDSSEKYVIKGHKNNKLWLIEEKGVDRWLITIDGIQEMLIETKIALSIISNYINQL